MHFPCPNCQQPVRLSDQSLTRNAETIDSIQCPSCRSVFSISEDETPTLLPGGLLRLGRFEILEKVGEGTFGIVYKAWDPDLKRHVAVKTPREGRLTPETARMFLREARAGAGISHSNVVSVYEIGEDKDRVYIASEFIDGVTLTERIKTRSFSPREAAALMVKILQAMQVFHEKSIIHRDLKPGNILIDNKNEPHITDFGLAMSDVGSEVTVTMSGRIVGTLAYMAPEQARGATHEITGRSDIFSAGVILYELLTNRRPFQASSSRTLLNALQNDDAIRPCRINRTIDFDLETICLVAMHKESERRYPSAAAMAEDLRLYLNNEPIKYRRTGLLEKAVKLIRRNLVASAAVLTAFMAVLFALTVPGRVTAAGIPVVIRTIPEAVEYQFVKYDVGRRVPLGSPEGRVTSATGTVVLSPGLYKVVAFDEQGRFHEVWRTVPDSLIQTPLELSYPHLRWETDSDGVVQLPSFRIFSRSEISDPMIEISGGQFEAGLDDSPGELAVRHLQDMPSLLVGTNEVSYERFRKIMAAPVNPMNPNGMNYLDWLRQRFGDRSSIPGDQPVSGYPPEVAILYCELAGVRLPTSIEYEFAATAASSRVFPSGSSPVVEKISDWSILSVSEPTPDTSEEGIRNLYYSLAEITDSIPVSYSVLFPDLIRQQYPEAEIAALSFQSIQPHTISGITMYEVRGAPAAWVHGAAVDGSDDRTLDVKVDSPRTRIGLGVAQTPMADLEQSQIFNRTGFRVYRTVHPRSSEKRKWPERS